MNKYQEYVNIYNRNFLEKNSSKGEHQLFWEVVLSGYLTENNIRLKRTNDTRNFLDFYFDIIKKRIHIEATAPTAGIGNNMIRKVPCSNSNSKEFSDIDNFESGIRNDDGISLRYTSCIIDKCEQISKKNISPNESVILAINAWDFINTWEFPFGEPPFIIRVLFGLSNAMCDKDGIVNYYHRNTITKQNSRIDIGYFNKQETELTGVIHSTINQNILMYRKPEKSDFLYIQNPYKNDLRKVFQDCMDIFPSYKDFPNKNDSAFDTVTQ